MVASRKALYAHRQRCRARSFVSGVLFFLVLPIGEARAEDLHFESRTDFQAYEVAGPSVPALLSRRRLVQNLAFRFSDQAGDESAVRWDVRARVRLDHEFGQSCLLARDYCLSSTSAGQPDDYLFLTEDARVDVPYASLGLTGLPGASELRLGRQLLTLAHRLRRIDGLAVATRPVSGLRFEAHAGFLPLAGGGLASDTFAPQGALSDPQTESVGDRPRLWSLGVSTQLDLPLGFSLQLGAEEVGEPAGSVERSVYGGAGFTSDGTTARALVVWDPSRELISDARAWFFTPLWRRSSLKLFARAEGIYHHPRFDLGTIWAFFEVAPTTQVRVGSQLHWQDDFTLGATLMHRTTHFSDVDDQRDYGGEVEVGGTLEHILMSLTGFAWLGDLDHWRGLRLHMERPLATFVAIRAGASLWDLSDPSRQVLSGLTVAEYAGVAWSIAAGTRLSAELQHGYSDISGHRWRIMSSLSIEVWR